MKKPGINRKQAEAILDDMLVKTGVELVDLEYHREAGGQMLRCYIDTPEGVGLETCQKVSKYIKSVLDEKEIIPYDYLEISSPGLNRVIKKDKDFIRFQGERIRIKTFEPVNGQRNFTGFLVGLESGCILIEIPDIEDDNKVIAIPRDNISNVRLHPEL